jgi:general secretion pathway protein J
MEDRYNINKPGGKSISQPGRGMKDGGFTLLELLVSMTLLVIIIVLMMGAVRIGSRSVAAGEKKMEEQERFRSVLSIIDAQIQSHVPLTYQEEGNKKYYFHGESKAMRLTTNYSVWDGRRGYVIVDYRVASGPSGKEIMTARESVPGVGGHRDVRLIEASSISFEYFRKESAEEQGRWVESLTDANLIPEKIRIHLTEGTKKLSLLFPVRVGGEMLGAQGGASPLSNIPKGAGQGQMR